MADSSHGNDPSERQRAWLQFRLRTLFALVTGCAGVFSLAGLAGPEWGAVGAFGVGAALFWLAYLRDDAFSMVAGLVMFGAALACLALVGR